MSELRLLLLIIFVISFGSLHFSWYFARFVLNKPTGPKEMTDISDAIREGAMAFLKRQYGTITLLSVVVALLIVGIYSMTDKGLNYGLKIGLSFLFGAICSAIAGYIGMWVSVRANIRTAAGAMTSINDAIRIALRGGAVSGVLVVAMSLFGVAGIFSIFYKILGVELLKIPYEIVGYGFGASFVALFAQLGGGIYTKAADVGADLVGKVEKGIPEDDPRNPAVVADLVGDNVGDCAGRGADLFESTAAENIGAMILGVLLYPVFGVKGILFPLVARCFGLVASIIGIMSVSMTEEEDPMHALNRGYYLSCVLATIGFGVAAYWLLRAAWLYFFLCGLIGIILSIAFVYITQYYTEYKFRPVREIAKASETGPATNIIMGFSVALECTAMPVFAISIALWASHRLGMMATEALRASGMAGVPDMGLYGTAVATMGMLGTAAYILAMDTFGPIADNAGGIVEMSRQPKEVRVKTDRLDAVGNTTKALTKGYAIGSAALAAFLLFSAYIDEVKVLYADAVKTATRASDKLEAFRAHLNLDIVSAPVEKIIEGAKAGVAVIPANFSYLTNLVSENIVNIGDMAVFLGALLGAMLVFWFSALAIKAVSKAAQSVIIEVRRQFKERPGIMEGTERPDYAACVDIVTLGALKQMVLPGILVIIMPTLVGILLKAEAVAAFLMVGTISGILMATLLNNGGGAWDNAKKFIELGEHGGKGSEAHKAAVVGDTVGDPFKDTAGPSIHVLVKLLSTITLVLAPLFI